MPIDIIEQRLWALFISTLNGLNDELIHQIYTMPELPVEFLELL